VALKVGTGTGAKNDREDSLYSRGISARKPLMMVSLILLVVLAGGVLLSFTSRVFWLPAVLLEQVLFAGTSAAGAMPESLSLLTNATGTGILIGMLVGVFALYLLAVRSLPRLVSHRFVLVSTLLSGIAYVCIPIVTSQDIFSYIAYARMGIIYHLNPLTTLPTKIASDPVYTLLYWTKQPSAYGPAWTMISCSLQWIALLLGLRHLLSMELLLRLLGLSMLLGSTQLIWSISGQLQGKLGGTFSGERQRRRAMLAFAWNPFLLFEACVNAHTDFTILFFVLLALWMLLDRAPARAARETIVYADRDKPLSQQDLFPLPQSVVKIQQDSRRSRWRRGNIQIAALMLAIAACIKITLLLLLPGFLLYLWTRRIAGASGKHRFRDVLTATGVYIGVIVLLYTPFWQHGALLQIVRVSPVITHDVNSPYQFVVCVIASLKGIPVPAVLEPGSQLEAISHLVSMTLFGLAYGGLCIWSLLRPRYVNTVPALIRWLALAELLYCVVGSPWFWPWYAIPLIGLLTVIEADGSIHIRLVPFLRAFPLGTFARVLTISMSTLCIIGAWKPGQSSLPLLSNLKWLYWNGYFPLLYHFRWDYFAGMSIWALPLAAIGIEVLLRQRKLARATVRLP